MFKRAFSFISSNLFKSKNSANNQNVSTPENQSTTTELPVQDISHFRIAIFTINKYLINKGEFTSNQLHFLINTEGYTLSKKQVWRVISKLHKAGYLDRVVLDSKKDTPYYLINTKLQNENRN